MSIFSDLLTGGVGSVVNAVADVADRFITTDKERMSAELELEKLGLEREKSYLADVDSSRKMQIAALQQDDVFSKRFIYWFSGAWSVFAMIFLVGVTFLKVPDENMNTVNVVLGFLLGTAISSIFNFFLGTSASSKRKDETISTLAGQ